MTWAMVARVVALIAGVRLSVDGYPYVGGMMLGLFVGMVSTREKG